MKNPVFSLQLPDNPSSCAVFSSPHSGSVYSDEYLARCLPGPLQLRSSEDAFVDELFSGAPASGAPLISSLIPRSYVDLNRSNEDLDPAMIRGISRRSLNSRTAAGLGVIPRVVAGGRPIASGKISLAAAHERINRCWRPFHTQLRWLLDEYRRRFGIAVLFDCHSMPRDALSSAHTINGKVPDIILGDRFGVSCAPWILQTAREAFTDAGFNTALNAPFAGGYITQTYGRPDQGIHALQIEINRSLYMDEIRIERRHDFATFADRISGVVENLVTVGSQDTRVAAE